MSPRVYVRKFDWDQARRLREQGLSYAAIGELLGVHKNAVRFACDGRALAMHTNANAERQRSGTCIDCGGRCSYNPSAGILRCRECAYDALTTTVRPTALRCVTCKEWKPDHAFAFSRTASELRRGRHKQCGDCNTIARRAFREAKKVPCEDGCGRMVEGKGRANMRTRRDGVRVELDPNRPYLCRPCAMRRVHARKRVAA